jgi:hypothetical protein
MVRFTVSLNVYSPHLADIVTRAALDALGLVEYNRLLLAHKGYSVGGAGLHAHAATGAFLIDNAEFNQRLADARRAFLILDVCLVFIVEIA